MTEPLSAGPQRPTEAAVRARLVDIQRLMRTLAPGKRLEPWQLIGSLLARVAELESLLQEARENDKR